MLGDSFIHKMFFEFLQPFGQFGKIRVSPFLVVVLNFDLVLGFWFGWKMGLSLFSRLHSQIQLMLEQGLSLYFPAVMMMEVLFSKNKSSITLGPRLKRSFPYCIVSEHHFLRDMVFHHWSIRMSIRVHRKAFQAITLLAYPRGLSLSRMYPIP